MLAISHAATGAAIALVIKQPALTLPFALVSHFICDSLPHVGLDEYGGHKKKPKLFHAILGIDAALLASFFAYLFLNAAPPLVFICVFLAGCPDFVWAYRYVVQERLGKSKEHAKNVFNRFHSKIQWSQTLKGSLFEIPYMFLMLSIVMAKL